MYTKFGLLLIFALIECINCGILIWGRQEIQIPSLKTFDDEDLDLLEAYMRRPKVIAFRGNPMEISDKLQQLLVNKYTAYVPRVVLHLDNIIELDELEADKSFEQIKRKLAEYDDENVLALLISSDARIKREIDDNGNDNSTRVSDKGEYFDTDTEFVQPSEGPVLYNANGRAMLYSSKPPILKTNSTSLALGKQIVATIDNRGGYSRLNVGVLVQGGKVTLRFKFLWNSGYWSLPSVEVLDTDSKTYILNMTDDLTSSQLISRNFSYHCGGMVAFSDADNEIELRLFDLQVQPDTVDGRFSDAFNCVPFTTAPIWSGIFVTFILIIVLSIGLGALNSIKTMDKFDDSKTKQLTITTSE